MFDTSNRFEDVGFLCVQNDSVYSYLQFIIVSFEIVYVTIFYYYFLSIFKLKLSNYYCFDEKDSFSFFFFLKKSSYLLPKTLVHILIYEYSQNPCGMQHS